MCACVYRRKCIFSNLQFCSHKLQDTYHKYDVNCNFRRKIIGLTALKKSMAINV